MNHDEWLNFRKKLDLLDETERKEAARTVTQVLKFIMDSIQPEHNKQEDTDLCQQYLEASKDPGQLEVIQDWQNV